MTIGWTAVSLHPKEFVMTNVALTVPATEKETNGPLELDVEGEPPGEQIVAK